MNGDPYIGMLETPVTSAPIVAGYLSNLPAYRTGVSPLLRGVEIGLAHGLLVGGSCRRYVSGASSCQLSLPQLAATFEYIKRPYQCALGAMCAWGTI